LIRYAWPAGVFDVIECIGLGDALEAAALDQQDPGIGLRKLQRDRRAGRTASDDAKVRLKRRVW